MPDGTMSIMYAKQGYKSQDVCEHLSMHLPPSRTQLFLYELHLASSNFLTRRLGAGEDIAQVYDSFPDQSTPFPYKSMFALRERDSVVDIKTGDGSTLHVRVKAFETCAEVIERIVHDKALANKSYELHEVNFIGDGSSLSLPLLFGAVVHRCFFVRRLGGSRKIKAYQAVADVVGSWKNGVGHALEFRAPLSMAAIRILLWDGSFKAVAISSEQTCKVVLKTLSDKLHSKKWWQLSLMLVSTSGTKRKVELEEKPMLLLESDSDTKLLCEEIPNAKAPSDADAPDVVVDPSELVDPFLERHSDVYLRLRAASYQTRAVELSFSTMAEPKNGPGSSFQYVNAENIFTLQMNVATSAQDLMDHLSTVVMPSLSLDVRFLVSLLQLLFPSK